MTAKQGLYGRNETMHELLIRKLDCAPAQRAKKIRESFSDQASCECHTQDSDRAADCHVNLLSGGCCNLEPVFLLHAQNLGDSSCILLFSGAQVASGLQTMRHHLGLYNVCLGTTRVVCNRDNAYTNRQDLQDKLTCEQCGMFIQHSNCSKAVNSATHQHHASCRTKLCSAQPA